MLLSALIHALGRCGIRISRCFQECGRDLASTTKGYLRDKAMGGVDTSYLLSHPSPESMDAEFIGYVPSGYKALSAMLGSLRFAADDVFVDYGCGKGRVLFAVAKHPLRAVVGIERDRDLADLACRNSKIFAQANPASARIEVIHSDATAFNPQMGTIFYMFNPFGERTMQCILDNIRASLSAHPRSIRILYNNPKHRHLLDEQEWLVPEGELGNSLVYAWRNSLVPLTGGRDSAEGIFARYEADACCHRI